MSSTESVRHVTSGRPDNETRFVRIPDQVITLGSPWQLIEGRFATTAGYAADAIKATEEHIDKLDALIEELEVQEFPAISVPSLNITPLNPVERPDFGELMLEYNWPKNTSEKPNLDDLPGFTELPFPVKNITYPVFKTPGAPEAAVVPQPGSPPTIGLIPDVHFEPIKLPDAPHISDVFVPSAPPIDIKPFEAKFLDVELEEPIGMSWSEAAYNSDVWPVFLDKLIENLLAGGKGLDPVVEEAIYLRMVSRLSLQHVEDYKKEETRWINNGWEEPPGALKARMTYLVAAQTRDKQDANRDVMAKQAEIANANYQFIMQLGKDAEIVLRNFHDSQGNRLLNAAEKISENSISLLNAYISKRNSNIELYKTEADIYKTVVEAALRQVEIFKAQVEGARVSAEVQKLYVDVYEAQIKGVEAVASYYQVLLENRKVSAEIEKIKIDIYKAEVDIYSARQAAEKIKAEIYGIEVESERVKAETLKAQLDAFVAEVTAVKETNLVRLQKLEYTLKKNDGELDRYKSELSAYGIELEAEGKRIEAITRGFEAEVSGYNAETNATGMYYSAKSEEIKAKVEEARFNFNVAVEQLKSVREGYIAIKELEIEATKGITGTTSQLASAAMNAVNATASYGYQSSKSFGIDVNYGANISENHSIPHDPEQ